MGTVLCIAPPCRTLPNIGSLGSGGQCCSHGYEQCDHCILLSALCDLCRVMCSTLSQERLQLHPVIFVPGPSNIQHSLTDNGSGTGKSEAPSAGGMFSGQSSVFGCIMIFRSGEVKVACDSIVYGHGYYKMLPVLYEPKTFLNV